jgi:hypothetical protein
MHFNYAHLAFWLAVLVVVGSAVAAPGSDVFREHFGVDRLVAVAALMGGFCAVTFAGSLVLTVGSVLNSIARVIASGAVGMYCGSLAAPLLSGMGLKVGVLAPATATFLVACGAPLIYAWGARRFKKEK